MKKMIKNLQNQQGTMMVEIVTLIAFITILGAVIMTMFSSTFEERKAEFGAPQAEQTATAEAKPLDVFSQMEKDVADYQTDAGYMTTEERQSTGYALLERLDVLLEQAEIAGNQTVVEEILTQKLQVENEINYGL